MAEDGEVLRQMWNSYLPICFSLAQNEQTSLEEPDPYYAMVSRLSYFPLAMDKVVKHFDKFKSDSRDLWLEFEGTPLKWHYPIGVLFDVLAHESTLPWNLQVHFQDFPEQQLVRCSSRASIESQFMSCLKEADCLKHRSEVMSLLQKKDHLQLWSGVSCDKFDQFWSINRKLMDSNFRFIPFRVYSKDLSQKQKLLKPMNPITGQLNTLRDLCLTIIDKDESVESYRWITQGIEPPLDTPLLWLSQHMSYCDNFLHISQQKS